MMCSYFCQKTGTISIKTQTRLENLQKAVEKAVVGDSYLMFLIIR